MTDAELLATVPEAFRAEVARTLKAIARDNWLDGFRAAQYKSLVRPRCVKPGAIPELDELNVGCPERAR
jgi:hypothetical protein